VGPLVAKPRPGSRNPAIRGRCLRPTGERPGIAEPSRVGFPALGGLCALPALCAILRVHVVDEEHIDEPATGKKMANILRR
jgi:hypothetical protein